MAGPLGVGQGPAFDAAMLRHATAQQIRGAMQALGVCMMDWLGESQRIVPKDEGTLSGTGEVVYVVNGMEFAGDTALTTATAAAVRAAEAGELREVYGQLQYGTAYAAYQHERTDLVHPNGRRAKYVSGPLAERGRRYQGIIGKAFQRGPVGA